MHKITTLTLTVAVLLTLSACGPYAYGDDSANSAEVINNLHHAAHANTMQQHADFIQHHQNAVQQHAMMQQIHQQNMINAQFNALQQHAQMEQMHQQMDHQNMINAQLMQAAAMPINNGNF